MKSHKILVQMILCAIFAAILCICSPLAIPVGPIPITLSVFAVLLCGVVLELKLSLISVAVYLLLGLFLPVFSRGMTGLAAFPGPTGGYIWSYPLMIVTLWLVQGAMLRLAGPRPARVVEYLSAFLGCAAALPVCYLCGTAQFTLVAHTTVRHALSVCVLPFLVPDLIKAAAAALLGVTLREILRKSILPSES